MKLLPPLGLMRQGEWFGSVKLTLEKRLCTAETQIFEKLYPDQLLKVSEPQENQISEDEVLVQDTRVSDEHDGCDFC